MAKKMVKFTMFAYVEEIINTNAVDGKIYGGFTPMEDAIKDAVVHYKSNPSEFVNKENVRICIETEILDTKVQLDNKEIKKCMADIKEKVGHLLSEQEIEALELSQEGMNCING